MNGMLAEIAKHMAFELKIIMRLLNKRLNQYVKIYEFKKSHKLLDKDTIKLFPDLRELEFHYYGSDSDIEILNNLGLLSLKFYLHRTEGKEFSFKFLENISKTLKKLKIGIIGGYRYIYGVDTTPIANLNLEYLDVPILRGWKNIDQKSLENMKLKILKTPGAEVMLKSNIIKYEDIILDYEFDDEYVDDFKPEEYIDKLKRIKDLNLYYLKIYIMNDTKCLKFLENIKVHELYISFDHSYHLENIIDLLYKLHISRLSITYYDSHNQSDCIKSKFPIEVLINLRIRCVILDNFIKYNKKELKILRDNKIDMIEK